MPNKCRNKNGAVCKTYRKGFRDGYCWRHRDQVSAYRVKPVQLALVLPGEVSYVDREIITATRAIIDAKGGEL